MTQTFSSVPRSSPVFQKSDISLSCHVSVREHTHTTLSFSLSISYTVPLLHTNNSIHTWTFYIFNIKNVHNRWHVPLWFASPHKSSLVLFLSFLVLGVFLSLQLWALSSLVHLQWTREVWFKCCAHLEDTRLSLLHVRVHYVLLMSTSRLRDDTDKRKISKEISSFVIPRLSINSSPTKPVMREWSKTLDEDTN